MKTREISTEPELLTYKEKKHHDHNKTIEPELRKKSSSLKPGYRDADYTTLGSKVFDKTSRKSKKQSSFMSDTIPVDRAGFLSYAFVTWISPLVWRIYKHRDRAIRDEDIWQCSERETSHINTERTKKCWDEELQKRGPEKSSMLRVWLKFTRTRLIILIGAICINSVLTFCMTGYMMGLFISYMEAPEANLPYGLGLVAISLVGQIFRAGSFAFISFFGTQTGVRFRAGVLGLVFGKMLKLKSLKSKDLAEIITIFGADAMRMQMNCSLFPYLVTLPLYLLIGTVYMYYLIGPWCFIAIGIYFLLYQLQAFSMRFLSDLRRKTLVFTDKRIRKTTEILNSMKFIKMYAWENPLRKAVEGIRNNEKKKLLMTTILDSMSHAIVPVASTLATVATLAPYFWVNQELQAYKAFAVVATLNYMRIILSNMPHSLRIFGESRISFERVKALLLKEEYQLPGNKCSDETSAVEIIDAAFKWFNEEEDYLKSGNKSAGYSIKKDKKKKNKAMLGNVNGEKGKEHNSPTPDLQAVNIKVTKGRLIGICGPVGGGKSSLLSAILGRMPKLSGNLTVSGSIAYVAQQAWIFPGTLKENILFGKPFNSELYADVLKACGLEPDLETMPNGDETEIGDRGINLSGGQKQRVSLARAVYSDSDIYLLDDPLSAVDVHVGDHLFQQCIKTMLKRKTIVLVTHQLQYLKHCDEIYVIENGVIAEQGDHEFLVSLAGYYCDLMAKYHSSDLMTSKESLESKCKNVFENERSSKKPDKSNGSTAMTKAGKLTTAEGVQTGTINTAAYVTYIKALGGVAKLLFMLIVYVVALGSTVFSDFWLSLWIDEINGPLSQTSAHNATSTRMDEIYDHVISSTNETNQQAVNSTMSIQGASTDVYFIVYCSSIAFILFLTFLKGLIGAQTMITAAENLHNMAFEKVLKAPMRFFDSSPPGTIINRFSRDMDEVDVWIPKMINSFLQLFIAIIISLIIVATYLPWVLLAAIPVLAACYFISRISSVTVRQIKRHQNVARSPLFGNLNTTGNGLYTIVSFSQQEIFYTKCLKLTDVTTTMALLFDGVMRWIGLRFDMTASFINVVTSLVMVLTKGTISPAAAGLSLSLVVRYMAIMQFVIGLLNELEARFTSVERIQEYIKDIESENETASKDINDSWPKEGRLTFSNVVMQYRDDMDPVLRNIFLDIKSKEKVGIVGRTGAGKSSLAIALFRLCDLSNGQIFVDDLDIADIPLTQLRSKLSIIPQDPVLFAETLRYNLDPFRRYSDDQLWSALEQVKIKEKVKHFEDQLEYLVEENGLNFSVGERQLFCLARAILQKNKILVLDEATSSIDTETDAMIQETIRESFADCTVLTIADRLNTVLHCDRVCILDNGQVLEMGTPEDLLADRSSIFYSMRTVQEVESST